MMEKHYLESLAKAYYKDGAWQLESGGGLVQAKTREKMLTFLHTLNTKLLEALEVHNAAAQKSREIHLVLNQPTSYDVPTSLLLLGRSQLKIAQRGDCLEISKITLEDYVREETALLHLRAEVSPLGRFLWVTKQGQRYNEDALLGFLLETLVQVHLNHTSNHGAAHT